jgi:hypothetical protein
MSSRVAYHRTDTGDEVEMRNMSNNLSYDNTYKNHRMDQHVSEIQYQAPPEPPYYPTNESDSLNSTLPSKVLTTLSSILAICLIALAIAQSRIQFMTLGYIYADTINIKHTIITAIIGLYATVVTIIVRYALQNSMILLTIRALNGRGRYMLKAKTWAYMSTGTGPLINGIPLILAGLTVTAIVTILPIIYVPGPYTADIVVFPTLENSISCWENKVHIKILVVYMDQYHQL